MNSGLESAIQEAMMELDKPSRGVTLAAGAGHPEVITLAPCQPNAVGASKLTKIRVGGGKRHKSR